MTPRRRAGGGLTLVELLVVLVILVLVASVAVTSTEGLVEQARFDATQRTLAAVEDAVLGPDAQRQPDGTRWVTGFVADMGRLPQFVDDADPAKQMQELWNQPAGVDSYKVVVSPLDGDIRIGAGWRGPYVRLALGGTTLLDGWGRRLRPLDASGSEIAAAGVEIAGVRNLGADDAAGGVGAYDGDVDVVFHRASPVLARHLGDVSGTVPATGLTGAGLKIVVRIFGADGDEVSELRDPVELPITGGAFTFTGIPIGPHALRAYVTDQPLPARNAAFADPAQVHRGRPAHVTVIQGGVSGLSLQVP